jgi:voltage-gated potassium channel
VSQVLSPEDLAGHTIAKGLEVPHAGELLMKLVQSEDHHLVERVIEEGAAPRPLSDVRAESHALVLGVVHQGLMSLEVSRNGRL